MSKDKEAKPDAKAGADGTAAKKKKKLPKKLIIIIAAAVLVLGGGGAGAYFFFFAKKAPAKTEAQKEAEAEAKLVEGKVVPLTAITVNLAEGHFLKVQISLQSTADVTEKLDGSKALQLLIDQFAYKSIAELSSNHARDEQMDELRKKVRTAYTTKKKVVEVMDVYLTEFVMQ